MAEEIGSNIDCFPEGNEVSFYEALSACKKQFSKRFSKTITQTQYINGLLRHLSVHFDTSDARLRSSGPLLGGISMKTGRLNALSLVSDFRTINPESSPST